MTLLNELSAAQAAQKIKSGEITSEQLVRACIERIEAREDVVKAWSAIDFDKAIADARACDAAPATGPLHGVPVGVKDVLNTFDLPTQMGSPIYDGNQSRNDAACVALARKSGAVILGKTVTCELAGIAPGATTNPHDVTRTPGGSSSGSAAAVADFMVPLAFGTQTGGSVLRPASYCGIVGYKPTYNTYNREGLKFAAESLDTIGLFARTVEDCALFSTGLTHQQIDARASKRAPRIGICQTPMYEKAKPETKKALDEAAAKAKEAGASVCMFKLPAKFARISETREVLNNVERARSLAWEWAHHRDLLSPQMTKSIELGLKTSEAAYHDELRFAEWARLKLDDLFADYDILLAPCVHGEAPVGLAFTGEPAFQGFWTCLHVPTLALPAARGRNKMPVAVQVIAPRWQDQRLLQASIWLRDRAGISLPIPKQKKTAE